MARYLIKDVKCDVVGGGPVAGIVVAAIQFERPGEEKWIHIVEVEGMPNAFITDEDIYDVLVEDSYDAEYAETLERTTESEIGGISLTADGYEEIYYRLNRDDSVPEDDKSFIRFVIAIVRGDWDIVDELKKKAIGHYIDEIDVPVTEEEEEYVEELEENE